MSEPYQLAALQPDGLPARDAVARVHRLLEDWSIQVAEDSLLVLHDTADQEPEVEPVSDADQALRRIVEWPALGTLDYGGPEGMVTVSYLGGSASIGLQGVLISAQERSVDRTNSVSRYQRLGAALHEELPARRTVMRWGLEMHGFRWQDELERLGRGDIVGSYPLLDLRRI
ncbi:MAG: hypothetical protein H0T54_03470 [Geodermatophilaceae bacterium]|nr:hypothetical protein [Geodermatophilaceae bacterium]